MHHSQNIVLQLRGQKWPNYRPLTPSLLSASFLYQTKTKRSPISTNCEGRRSENEPAVPLFYFLIILKETEHVSFWCACNPASIARPQSLTLLTQEDAKTRRQIKKKCILTAERARRGAAQSGGEKQNDQNRRKRKPTKLLGLFTSLPGTGLISCIIAWIHITLPGKSR